MALQSGHKIVPLSDEEQEKINGLYDSIHKRHIRLVPDNWFFTDRFRLFADKIYDFKFKSTDILLMTFPKCGTTWTQEIIWTMKNNPNLNHPMANLNPNIKAPFLEADTLVEIKMDDKGALLGESVKQFRELCAGKDPKDGIFLQAAAFSKDPRTIKTHLPFSLLAPSLLDTAKVVYVVRNPKDVVVSMCHHQRIIKNVGFKGTFEDYIQLFLDGTVMFAPYGPHLKEAWERRNHPNLHFIFYEEMKADPLKEIKRLNTFMETNLTEEQMQAIVKYTSFEEMKARDELSKDVNTMRQEVVKNEGGFYRKGQVGDSKNKFSPEMEAEIDQWIEKNFTSFGFTFK